MKNMKIFPMNRMSRVSVHGLIMLCMLGLLLHTPASYAQDEKEVYRTRMSLSANQNPDATMSLDGLLRARIEGSYQKVPMEMVRFYGITMEGEESFLGEAETGENGVARFKLKSHGLVQDEEGYMTFLARFEGDDELSESEGDIRIRPARLEMTPVENEGVYALSFQALAETPEGHAPVTDAVISVFVKRMFSSLKVGEGTTDENGQAEIEFPSDLAGDEHANLIITARIDETDDYGNLVSSLTQPWGSPVSAELRELPPALWSPHPPMWMFVTFIVLIVAVWGHYLIIVLKLRKILRLSKNAELE